MTGARAVLIAILLGGLAAGTLDIGAATLISGANPLVILRFIASGLVGKSAMGGGDQTAMLGMLLQWAMSLIIAAIYVLASLRVPALTRLWIAGGIGYGVIVYFVMEYVVVPLSAVGHAPKFVPLSFVENLAAMLVFGLIVAGAARSQLAPERPEPRTA